MQYPTYFVEHKTPKGWEISREFGTDKTAALEYFEDYLKYQEFDRTSTAIDEIRLTQKVR